MKKYILLLLVLTLWSCSSDDNSNGVVAAQETMNVSYGSDTQQKYDIYLPAGRNSSFTKVLILCSRNCQITISVLCDCQYRLPIGNRNESGVSETN